MVIRNDYGSIIPVPPHQILAERGDCRPRYAFAAYLAGSRGEELTTVAEFGRARESSRLPVRSSSGSRRSLSRLLPSTRPSAAGRHHGLVGVHWTAACARTKAPLAQEAVVRFAGRCAYKALTYHPTGGIVAAPTTSLPEQLGGVRNWDYRFCWIRDASFTLYSLLPNGYIGRGRGLPCEWRLRAVAGKPSQMNILYGVHGERRLSEIELDWLPGYENSKPVRTGNAAYEQVQLDVFGEIMDTMRFGALPGYRPGRKTLARVVESLLEFLETALGSKPDVGIWEIRGPRQHFTHSKVMVWVAFDRMVKIIEQFGVEGPVERYRALREQIHAEVCRRGFDSAKQNTFVQHYDSQELDASLLMIPLVGFLPAEDPRVAGTEAAIERELLNDGFVKRYATSSGVDGLPPGEGAFQPCTFWLVDNYKQLGRQADAERLFERLLSLRNDVGLLAEEYDPTARRLVGNFPQAFSHVSLVNSAVNLEHQSCPAHHRRQA